MTPTAPPPNDQAQMDELWSDALTQARELLRAELALARAELRAEVAGIKRGFAVGLVGILMVHAALLCLAASLVLALGAGTSAAGAVGACLLLIGMAALGLAQGLLFRRHMARTRARLLQGEESQHGGV